MTPRIRHVRAPSTVLLKLLLLLICCCVLCAFRDVEAVNVGEPETVARRHLISAASGSADIGDGAETTCPNATTITISSSSSAAAQITKGGADCKSEVVKSVTVTEAKDTTRVLLDVHGKGIVIVKSVPSDVQTLNLNNNSINSLDEALFPSALLSLDLSSNALTTLKNASFPSKLTILNVSRNPIASMKSAKFPSSLVQLDLTRTKMTAVENFSFPDAIVSLNLSGNALTKIAGVAFPNSLVHLSINSMDPVFSSDVTEVDTASLFEEFEVRQSDADLFAQLKTFDVAATTNLICSDTRAKRNYVLRTMLCVITDEVFNRKYGDIDSASGTSGGSGSSSGSALVGLDEDLDQKRSWFLIIAAATLGGFVASVFCVAVCRAWGRRLLKKKNQSRKFAMGDDTKLMSRSTSKDKATEDDDDRDEGRWGNAV